MANKKQQLKGMNQTTSKRREIKFRGISLEDGKMIYGTSIIKRDDWSEETKKWTNRCFILNGNSCNQTPKIEGFVEVKIETLGQSTGLEDKNGKDIYEGDVVIIIGSEPSTHAEVKYEAPRFIVEGKRKYSTTTLNYWSGKDLKVIGNIYESPELLTTNKQ